MKKILTSILIAGVICLTAQFIVGCPAESNPVPVDPPPNPSDYQVGGTVIRNDGGTTGMGSIIMQTPGGVLIGTKSIQYGDKISAFAIATRQMIAKTNVTLDDYISPGADMNLGKTPYDYRGLNIIMERWAQNEELPTSIFGSKKINGISYLGTTTETGGTFYAYGVNGKIARYTPGTPGQWAVEVVEEFGVGTWSVGTWSVEPTPGTWSQVLLGVDLVESKGGIKSLLWLGGQNYIAIGGTVALTSNNNLQSTTQSDFPFGGTVTINAAANSGNTVIVVCEGGTTATTINNGSSWSWNGNEGVFGGTINLVDIAAIGGTFVTIADTDGIYAVSTDAGASWTMGTISLLKSYTLKKIAGKGNQFIVITTNGKNAVTVDMTGAGDAWTWNINTTPPQNDGSNDTFVINAVTYFNGGSAMVAAGEGGFIARSKSTTITGASAPNWGTWYAHNRLRYKGENITGAAYGDGKFFFTSDKGSILYSILPLP